VLLHYPRLTSGPLFYLDLSLGLLLVAISEELLARRVAARLLAELGWPPAAIVVVPALAFGLQHWSLGLGNMATTALVGMALMAIYLYWRSFALVVIAHYVLNLWVFV
jgi:CAAX protease family protein